MMIDGDIDDQSMKHPSSAELSRTCLKHISFPAAFNILWPISWVARPIEAMDLLV